MIEDLERRMDYVINAVAASKFYRKKYGIEHLDHSASKRYILKNFEKLPYLTRSELPELHMSCLNEFTDSRVVYTGGTTGVSGILEYSNEGLMRDSKLLREPMEMCGITEGMTFLSTIGTTSSVCGLTIDLLAIDMKCRLIQFANANSTNYEAIEAIAERVKVDAIYGTPMGILGFTKDKKLMKALKGVKAIMVSGAPLDVDTYEAIRKAFKCPVVDQLGSTEVGSFAYRFSPTEPFTIPKDIVIIETDKRTHEVVMTGLVNNHMPVVRYKNGDRGHLTDDGRYVLEGRIFKDIKIDKIVVSMSLFFKICEVMKASDMFQLTKENVGKETHLILNIVGKKKDYDMKVINKLISAENPPLFKKIEDGTVKFEIKFIEPTEVIGLNFRGKYRRYVEL